MMGLMKMLLSEEVIKVPAVLVNSNTKLEFKIIATVDQGEIPKGIDATVREIKLQFYGDRYPLTKSEKIRRWIKWHILQKFLKKM